MTSAPPEPAPAAPINLPEIPGETKQQRAHRLAAEQRRIAAEEQVCSLFDCVCVLIIVFFLNF